MPITRVTDHVYTDGFGNAYINRKDNRLVNAFNGYSNSTFGGTAVTAAAAEVGILTSVSTLAQMSFTFPGIDGEVHTNPTATRRFTISISGTTPTSTANLIFSNTTPNTTAVGATQVLTTNQSGFSFSTSSATQFTYMVLNNRSACLFAFDTVSGRHKFVACGWAYRPLPFDNDFYRFNNAYILFAGITSAGAVTNAGIRGNINDTTVLAPLSTTSYPINCADSQTPLNPWATNLILIDQEYLGVAVGVVDSNLLLASGSFVVGTVYKIESVGNNISGVSTNDSPNTEVPTFMCVGNWGSNFLLMRTLTFGYV